MIDTAETLQEIAEKDASDIFVIAGHPLTYKAYGVIKKLNEIRLLEDDTRDFVESVYRLADNRSTERLLRHGDDDFSFTLEGVSRFRVNAYRQQGALSAVIRIIRFEVPDPNTLGIPEDVMALANQKRGLVLISGPAGSGKSTTLACLIDKINSEQIKHIITIEDPIEFLHPHKMSLVSQREIITDTDSYETALLSALRQSPDVIQIGAMDDPDIIRLALTAAESGRLVFAPMHTEGIIQTIMRLIGSFPADRRSQACSRIANSLTAVVSQTLYLGSADESPVSRFDTMLVTDEIRRMIREDRIADIAAAHAVVSA